MVEIKIKDNELDLFRCVMLITYLSKIEIISVALLRKCFITKSSQFKSLKINIIKAVS